MNEFWPKLSTETFWGGREQRVGPLAASTGIEPSYHAQGFATARNLRAHRSDRQVYNRCGFLVPHPFQPYEQDYRPLLLGQLGESALQISEL
jgi:hypothetical protein